MIQTSKIYILSLCLVLTLVACGGKEVAPPGTMPPPAPSEKPQDVTWNFQKDGISLTIISSDNLNFMDEIPHAVRICIYQTDNLDLVKTKAETEEGLRELLKCKSSPPERIQAQHIYVQPSSTLEKKLDRAENAKYMFVVAGFNKLNTETSFSSMHFPLHTEKTGQWTIFFSKTIYSAVDVNARIDLSSESVHLQGVERVQE